MKIGMDIDMSTNIAEGYTICEFKKKELYKNGVFDPDCAVRFYAHIPDYLKKEMGIGIGEKQLILDTYLSANDVYDMYMQHQKEIDRMSGQDKREVPQNEIELLHLADDVNAYCGLE